MKKKRMKVKKKNKSVSEKKGMIKEAISDIDREIVNINKQKTRLNQQIKSSDKTLMDYRQFEENLQKRIAKLIQREASLRDKKKGVIAKEEKLSERLSKVKKIKSELDDV